MVCEDFHEESVALLEDEKDTVGSRRWLLPRNSGVLNFQLTRSIVVLLSTSKPVPDSVDQIVHLRAATYEVCPPPIEHSAFLSTIRSRNVSVIGSRDQLCLLPEVNSLDSSSAKIFACRGRVQTRTCDYYRNFDMKRDSLMNTIKAEGVVDIEDLVKLGKSTGCCPYYMSRESKTDAEIIFTPYNYLLDPKIRKLYNIELQNTAVIFDEAHNIVRSSWSMLYAYILSKTPGYASRTTAEYECICTYKCLVQQYFYMMHCSSIITAPAVPLSVDSWNLSTFWNEVSEFLKVISILVHCIADLFQVVFDSKNVSPHSNIFSLLRLPGVDYSHCYRVFAKDEQLANRGRVTADRVWDSRGVGSNQPVTDRTLSYWCLSPGRAMQDLIKERVRCVILTSGTLYPIEPIQSELHMNFPISLQNPHVIKPEQVRLAVITRGKDGIALNSSYATRDKPEYRTSLGLTLVEIIQIVPAGLLVFFTSYGMMSQCVDAWKNEQLYDKMLRYKRIFVEPRDKVQFAKVFSDYRDVASGAVPCDVNGAALFAVMRGRASEGLDLADFAGRGVVVLGLPYPPFHDARVRLKMSYLDEQLAELNNQASKSGSDAKAFVASHPTGKKWYNQQAWRAVNQSIGRVIRHHRDFGAIFLCDERFAQVSARSQFPHWMQPSMRVYTNLRAALEETSTFYKRASILVATANLWWYGSHGSWVHVGSCFVESSSGGVFCAALCAVCLAWSLKGFRERQFHRFLLTLQQAKAVDMPTSFSGAIDLSESLLVSDAVNGFVMRKRVFVCAADTSVAEHILYHQQRWIGHVHAETSSAGTSVVFRASFRMARVLREASVNKDENLEIKLLQGRPTKRIKLLRPEAQKLSGSPFFSDPFTYVEAVKSALSKIDSEHPGGLKLRTFKQAIQLYREYISKATPESSADANLSQVEALHKKLCSIFSSPETSSFVSAQIKARTRIGWLTTNGPFRFISEENCRVLELATSILPFFLPTQLSILYGHNVRKREAPVLVTDVMLSVMMTMTKQTKPMVHSEFTDDRELARRLATVLCAIKQRATCLLHPSDKPYFHELLQRQTREEPDGRSQQASKKGPTTSVKCSKCGECPARTPLVSACKHVACFGCWRTIIEEQTVKFDRWIAGIRRKKANPPRMHILPLIEAGFTVNPSGNFEEAWESSRIRYRKGATDERLWGSAVCHVGDQIQAVSSDNMVQESVFTSWKSALPFLSKSVFNFDRNTFTYTRWRSYDRWGLCREKVVTVRTVSSLSHIKFPYKYFRQISLAHYRDIWLFRFSTIEFALCESQKLGDKDFEELYMLNNYGPLQQLEAANAFV
ncbi:regulator of telomere elongation helicase 1 [Clonorchis sinensis]|uniref:Regulator of telomere elongation helicase 1 homolog n=1 Tax=Clonorchis sinensis TaxID=79923 RepID=H2KPL2_CLOSI|nr:regulator of telomere elongation helicase 1 [Clonorchis sinensis]